MQGREGGGSAPRPGLGPVPMTTWSTQRSALMSAACSRCGGTEARRRSWAGDNQDMTMRTGVGPGGWGAGQAGQAGQAGRHTHACRGMQLAATPHRRPATSAPTLCCSGRLDRRPPLWPAGKSRAEVGGTGCLAHRAALAGIPACGPAVLIWASMVPPHAAHGTPHAACLPTPTATCCQTVCPAPPTPATAPGVYSLTCQYIVAGERHHQAVAQRTRLLGGVGVQSASRVGMQHGGTRIN